MCMSNLGSGHAVPVGIGCLEVFFRIYATGSGASGGYLGHTDLEAVGQWTELFEPLNQLQRVWRPCHPTQQGLARVGIDPDVLPYRSRERQSVGVVSQERNGRSGKIERQTRVGADHLDHIRLGQNGHICGHGRRAYGSGTGYHDLHCAQYRLA